MMIPLTIVTLIFGAALLLWRAMRGPTVFDRILAVNAVGTKTVLLVVAFGFLSNRAEYSLDTALVYALINFTATLAVLKLVQHRRLG